jgi:hypothetical protein
MFSAVSRLDLVGNIEDLHGRSKHIGPILCIFAEHVTESIRIDLA